MTSVPRCTIASMDCRAPDLASVSWWSQDIGIGDTNQQNLRNKSRLWLPKDRPSLHHPNTTICNLSLGRPDDSVAWNADSLLFVTIWRMLQKDKSNTITQLEVDAEAKWHKHLDWMSAQLDAAIAPTVPLHSYQRVLLQCSALRSVVLSSLTPSIHATLYSDVW